jgi:5'-nucleotidase
VGWTLITNDDGIAAPGLRALAGAAAATGRRVVVAAPAEQASGTGASIMTSQVEGRVPVARHELPGLPEVPAYGVAATPAFIVFAALRGWFAEPPELVLSGINEGVNCGRAVLHSGTVGAALTAGRLGVPALAVSLDCDDTPPDVQPCWSTAAGLVPGVLELLTSAGPDTVLNLNVPDRPATELLPIRAATLAGEGKLHGRVDHLEDGHLGVRLIDPRTAPEPGSDVALLAAGYPTLTALGPVTDDLSVPLAELLAARSARSG